MKITRIIVGEGAFAMSSIFDAVFDALNKVSIQHVDSWKPESISQDEESEEEESFRWGSVPDTKIGKKLKVHNFKPMVDNCNMIGVCISIYNRNS